MSQGSSKSSKWNLLNMIPLKRRCVHDIFCEAWPSGSRVMPLFQILIYPWRESLCLKTPSTVNQSFTWNLLHMTLCSEDGHGLFCEGQPRCSRTMLLFFKNPYPYRESLCFASFQVNGFVMICFISSDKARIGGIILITISDSSRYNWMWNNIFTIANKHLSVSC